jgi:xanthine dehydrogenase YagT iron-sulfur-binding subunit
MHEKDAGEKPRGGLTRRGFMGSLGAGAATAAVAGGLRPAAAEPVAADALVAATLRINGQVHRVMVEPRSTLLRVMRDKLGITGPKAGCERGECGSCTVLIDGKPRYACLTLALEAEDAEITSVEGLMSGEELGDVQKAFASEDALQCGFCTPGQIVAAEGLLRANPHPSFDEIRHGMSGNVCRCGAYAHIVKAVAKVAESRGAKGGAR